MDGYQVAAKIKERPGTHSIAVIMLTALDDNKARMLGLNAGAEDFLTKPVDRAELVCGLRSQLRLKAYGDKLRGTLAALSSANEQLDRHTRESHQRSRLRIPRPPRLARLQKLRRRSATRQRSDGVAEFWFSAKRSSLECDSGAV